MGGDPAGVSDTRDTRGTRPSRSSDNRHDNGRAAFESDAELIVDASIRRGARVRRRGNREEFARRTEGKPRDPGYV